MTDLAILNITNNVGSEPRLVIFLRYKFKCLFAARVSSGDANVMSFN